MKEAIPLVLGALLGLLASAPPLRRARRSVRGLTLAGAAIVLGGLATVVTGEWRLSWAFLLFDVPLVLLSMAATGYVLGRHGPLSIRSAQTVEGSGELQ